jgi:hypothetical protein
MSIQTSIVFLNANDPEFIKARDGTPEEREEWEEFNGDIKDRPGAEIETGREEGVSETDDEYGGYLIELSKIPKEATHICVFRS